MVNVDRVIIGTSPLALVEATYLKSMGLSVVNVDERNVVGGAWTTIKQDGLPEIEIGCHIWSYHKESYQLISELLDLKLVRISPQPKILVKGYFIPYDWKSNILSLKKLIKNITKTNELFKHPDFRFAIKPSSYLYPEKGAYSIKKGIEKIVKDNELTIELNTSVKSIVINEGGVDLLNADKKLLVSCKELILTSLSCIDSITFSNKEVLKLETRKVDYIHVHILLNSPPIKKFSYVRVKGDDTVHRISDMTFQVDSKINVNESLICIGVFSKAYYGVDHKSLLSYINIFLIKNKFISKDTLFLNYSINTYPSYYNNSELMNKIQEKDSGKIKFLRSTDFVYSFFNQKKRYKTLLSGNTK